MNELLKKDVVWAWDKRRKAAFEEVKKAFTRCVRLDHPDLERPYLIRCDASGIAVAAILAQVDEQGDERMIEITSRSLTPVEKKYSATELELLALIHATKKWRHYLIGSKATVKTDHQALSFLSRSSGLSARLTR